jgi:hypothetical protein
VAIQDLTHSRALVVIDNTERARNSHASMGRRWPTSPPPGWTTRASSPASTFANR